MTDDARRTFSTILVPTDFSPHSDKALQIATSLAIPLSARVHLLLAFGYPVPPSVPGEIIIPNDYWGTDEPGAHALLRRRFESVIEAGVAGEIHLVHGHPENVIAKTAEQLPAELIIMGTRGRTGLAHVLLGSVAERTIRLAGCPVMIVRTPDADVAWESQSLADRSPT